MRSRSWSEKKFDQALKSKPFVFLIVLFCSFCGPISSRAQAGDPLAELNRLQSKSLVLFSAENGVITCGPADTALFHGDDLLLSRRMNATIIGGHGPSLSFLDKMVRGFVALDVFPKKPVVFSAACLTGHPTQVPGMPMDYRFDMVDVAFATKKPVIAPLGEIKHAYIDGEHLIKVTVNGSVPAADKQFVVFDPILGEGDEVLGVTRKPVSDPSVYFDNETRIFVDSDGEYIDGGIIRPARSYVGQTWRGRMQAMAGNPLLGMAGGYIGHLGGRRAASMLGGDESVQTLTGNLSGFAGGLAPMAVMGGELASVMSTAAMGAPMLYVSTSRELAFERDARHRARLRNASLSLRAIPAINVAHPGMSLSASPPPAESLGYRLWRWGMVQTGLYSWGDYGFGN